MALKEPPTRQIREITRGRLAEMGGFAIVLSFNHSELMPFLLYAIAVAAIYYTLKFAFIAIVPALSKHRVATAVELWELAGMVTAAYLLRPPWWALDLLYYAYLRASTRILEFIDSRSQAALERKGKVA